MLTRCDSAEGAEFDRLKSDRAGVSETASFFRDETDLAFAQWVFEEKLSSNAIFAGLLGSHVRCRCMNVSMTTNVISLSCNNPHLGEQPS